ncbi:MAG: 4'-phosphopantetheinyl transferase superfamily protein [Methylobacteriaceae bacterium]|nr:4'-phosphopantetheinyl transferase superfamily protein [Methylobacteriaceae bacterium]
MALLRSLNPPLAPESSNIFLLTLDDAGDATSLPPTETERAEADTLAASHRTAFLARRRLLRRAVALRLGIAPGEVLIARDAQGAPCIISPSKPIFVSLASRGEFVAIALSDRPVGVDVEMIGGRLPEPAWNILHPSEREWLSKQRTDDQANQFLALWCVKEAYLKAIGLGLRREATEIAVSVLNEPDVSIADSGRPVALSTAFVSCAEAYGATAILACVVLAR